MKHNLSVRLTLKGYKKDIEQVLGYIQSTDIFNPFYVRSIARSNLLSTSEVYINYITHDDVANKISNDVCNILGSLFEINIKSHYFEQYLDEYDCIVPIGDSYSVNKAKKYFSQVNSIEASISQYFKPFLKRHFILIK
ncbi:hypothetical protein [Orbus mooreae]|uniref:hypothetical protein n=1 Tax=Orbus mooreae TaxID=3074107 RepID=UPI00370D2E0B